MTLLYFILILGVTIFFHELGHFIFAKKAKIHVYEFSLGMGPRIFKFNRQNDETTYSIRLFPIGGYVSMSGEEIEADERIPVENRMQSKTWLQRFLVIVAGVMFNFILAIVLLFLIALSTGAQNNKPYIAEVDQTFPAYNTKLAKGDLILKINDKKIRSVDRMLLELQLNYSKPITVQVKDTNDKIKTIALEPLKIKENNEEVYRYGFIIDTSIQKGLGNSIKFAWTKTYNIIEQMVIVVKSLFTGKLKLNSLAGPVGIYGVVGQSAKAGFINIIYLIAFLSINLGFVNILPFPAFDGGRLLFLIIEKIKGSPVDTKIENTVHTIGFVLLLILMVVVTYNDIMRVIK